MSSRLIQVLLALSLLLNTFVLMGFVYRSWIAPPPFERPMPPPPGQRPSALETVTRDLNLDDSQRQALRGVFDQYATTRRERLREIQKLRDQLAAEYKRPTIDMARVDTLIDQLTNHSKAFLKGLEGVPEEVFSLDPPAGGHSPAWHALHIAEALVRAVGHAPPTIVLTADPSNAELPWMTGAPLWMLGKPFDGGVLLAGIDSLARFHRLTHAARQ